MQVIILTIVWATLWQNKLWFLLPLIVSVSLVYGATRHELMGPIVQHSVRSVIWILGFMAIILAVLALLTWLV